MPTVPRLVTIPAALAVSAGVGALVDAGSRLSDAGPLAVPLLLGGMALERRRRDRPMRWLAEIRLPGGERAAGLVAPLSRPEAAFWTVSVAAFAVFAAAWAGVLLRSGGPVRPVLGVLAAGLSALGAHHVLTGLPDLSRVAIVEAGVVARRRLIPWAEIVAVRIVGRDVELVLTAPRRPVGIRPDGSMIDPAELKVAVNTYLRAPQRRAELRSPVDPRGAVVFPGRAAES